MTQNQTVSTSSLIASGVRTPRAPRATAIRTTAAVLAVAISAAHLPYTSAAVANHDTVLASSDTTEDQRALLVAELLRYTRLPQNWDGSNGVAPSLRAAFDAIRFLDFLPLALKLPTSHASGDGEIAFSWQSDRQYIEVGFRGLGGLSYYAENSQTGERSAADVPFDSLALPVKLIDALIAYSRA